eukprot:IDg21223t1
MWTQKALRAVRARYCAVSTYQRKIVDCRAVSASATLYELSKFAAAPSQSGSARRSDATQVSGLQARFRTRRVPYSIRCATRRGAALCYGESGGASYAGLTAHFRIMHAFSAEGIMLQTFSGGGRTLSPDSLSLDWNYVSTSTALNPAIQLSAGSCFDGMGLEK